MVDQLNLGRTLCGGLTLGGTFLFTVICLLTSRMIRTDRFKGFLSVFGGAAALVLSWLAFTPSLIASGFEAPIYVGYQLSIQVLLLISLVIAILYLLSVVETEINSIRADFSESLLVITEEAYQELGESGSGSGDGDISTDGGQEKIDIRGQEQDLENKVNDSKTNPWYERFAVETTGIGVLIGVVLGGIIGIIFGRVGILVGGIIGAFVGNEIEYRRIRHKRRLNLGPKGQLSELQAPEVFAH